MAAFRILALLVVVVCPAALHAKEPSGRQLYKQARKAEKEKDFSRAYLFYSQAAAKDPTRKQYWIRAQALRTRAAMAANVMPVFDTSSVPESEEAAPVEPPTPKELEEARKPQPPFELKASQVRLDFDLRGDAEVLFSQVAKGYGLDVIMDGDYRPGATPIRFRMTQADYREALYGLMTVTGSFIVPIGDRVFMVVKDTEQKRREVENHIAIAIPIPEPVTVQEAQELGRAVQQLMEIQRFSIDSSQRVVIFRDRASKVRPAQALLAQLLMHRPEIAMEVELIAVGKSTSLKLGLGFPAETGIIPLADTGRHAVSVPSQFLKFLALGGGSTYLGLGVGSAQLLAMWSKSVGQSMLKSEMRTIDGQAASFHVGDKYPIMTMGYFGATTPGEQVYRPPPTFNFEDLGLVLKVTPKVHDSREVTLDVEAEFKMLGTQSFNGIPVIGSRKFANRVRLNFDQSAVIAGLVNNTETLSISGLAGITSVPVLGTILGRTARDREKSEILLVIRPRLLSLPATETVPRPIFIGAESRLLTPM